MRRIGIEGRQIVEHFVEIDRNFQIQLDRCFGRQLDRLLHPFAADIVQQADRRLLLLRRIVIALDMEIDIELAALNRIEAGIDLIIDNVLHRLEGQVLERVEVRIVFRC